MALAVDGNPPPRLEPPEYLDQPEQTLFAEITEACSPAALCQKRYPTAGQLRAIDAAVADGS